MSDLKVVETRRDHTQRAILIMLVDWLERAKRGEYDAVVIVGKRTGSKTVDTSQETEDPILAIGALELVKHQLTKECYDNSKPFKPEG